MKNLLDISQNESDDFINSFDMIISDINGVLWNDFPITNVKETISKLKKRGKSVYYVSNNSFVSFEEFKNQFSKIGVNLQTNDLINPTCTLIHYLNSINFNKKIYCISGTDLQNQLVDAGYECVSGHNEYAESVRSGLLAIQDEPEIGAVYVDVDINLNYVKLCKAVEILKRPEVLYIAGALDRLISVTSTLNVMGSGVFIDIISEQSKRKPIVLGKPSEYLKKIVMNQFKIENPRRIIFVGDVLKQDMAFASMCNFQKLFVLSGVDTMETVNSETNPELKPDFYLESLGDLLKIL